MRSAKALVLVGIWACSGNPTPPPAPPAPPVQVADDTPAPGPAPTPTEDPCSGAHADPCSGGGHQSPPPVEVDMGPPFSVPDAHPPEWRPPPWKKVAVGQTIALATAAIDQDLDETAVTVTKMPASARFDAITQTIVWTPAATDKPKGQFEIEIAQPGRGKKVKKAFSIAVVDGKAVPPPVAPPQTPVIETLLMIRQPGRLVQANQEWPLTRMLEVGAESFKLQFPADRRTRITDKLDGPQAFRQLLYALSLTHQNPRLDPSSPKFDRAAFGDPASWKIVAVRPRIDRAWTELRVVYQATNAPEPVFAMFRLRPVVEYAPPAPRPPEEKEANNKLFLGMVAKHLMKDGGPNPAFAKDEVAHGKAVAALMTELMTYDDTKTKPYLHGFMIGIASEARMGGGSARNADGSYKSGDGWAWGALKPFQSSGGPIQVYQNVAVPGFWTDAVPSKDNSTWVPRCATRFNPADNFIPGFEHLCRPPVQFVDLPEYVDGHIEKGKLDAVNKYFVYKKKWMVENVALEDGRRDLGEENGMSCAQCHIRNFGMHDWRDPANVDPAKGVPKKPNKKLATLNFQIIPTSTWEAFTIDFLHHQECRGKQHLEKYLGAASAKRLTCPLLKK